MSCIKLNEMDKVSNPSITSWIALTSYTGQKGHIHQLVARGAYPKHDGISKILIHNQMNNDLNIFQQGSHYSLINFYGFLYLL